MSIKSKTLIFILFAFSIAYGWYSTFRVYDRTDVSISNYLPNGNTLVAGVSSRAGDYCSFFRWLTASGDSLNTWILQWDNDNSLRIQDMVTDLSGENVYFTMVDMNFDPPDSLYIGKMSIDGDSIFMRSGYTYLHSPRVPQIFFDDETTMTVVSGDRGSSYPVSHYIVVAKGDTMGNLAEYARYETPFDLSWPFVFRKNDSAFYTVCKLASSAIQKTYILELSNYGDSLRAAMLPIDSCNVLSCLYSPDNGVFLAGSKPMGIRAMWLCNLDTNFTINWERTYNFSLGDEVIRDITLLPDGNIAASCLLWDFSGLYLALVVFDGTTGDTLFTVHYDTLDVYISYDLIRAPNGDFIISGQAENIDGPAFVMRVDSLGNDTVSAIDEIRDLPSSFDITAYPNPFNSAVSITAPTEAEIEIFDVNGRLIDVIARSPQDDEAISPLYAGDCFGHIPRNDSKSEFTWHPDESLPSGVYLVRARFDTRSLSGAEASGTGAVATKRLVYLK